MVPLANEKQDGTWMMLRVQGMRCCPFWGAIYAAGAAQLAVYGFASVAIGFATQASVFTGAAWWLWLALVAAQIHCAMGLVVLVAALAPSRRLLALGTSFGLLISIVVAMVICSVMVAQQGPADVPQRFFSWPWFLLVFPLFAYPRAVFVLMAYGTQSGTAPFTDPSEAAVEVYIVVALLFAVGTIAGVVGIYFFAVLPAQVRRARVVPMSCSSRGNVSWRQMGARRAVARRLTSSLLSCCFSRLTAARQVDGVRHRPNALSGRRWLRADRAAPRDAPPPPPAARRRGRALRSAPLRNKRRVRR